MNGSELIPGHFFIRHNLFVERIYTLINVDCEILFTLVNY